MRAGHRPCLSIRPPLSRGPSACQKSAVILSKPEGRVEESLKQKGKPSKTALTHFFDSLTGRGRPCLFLRRARGILKGDGFGVQDWGFAAFFRNLTQICCKQFGGVL